MGISVGSRSSLEQAEHQPSGYNEIEYPTHVNPDTHPDLLATMAILFGMEPAPVQHCRTLEIGCGDGSNVIAMAVELTEANFTGIDLATKPIQDAQSIIDRTKLVNVAVRAMDLLNITPDFGRFDYIIVHGVYSWVPGPVQEKILSICKENLNPNGVALVSYNAYPGCYIRQAVRELMLFGLEGEMRSDAVQKGIATLKLFGDAAPESGIWKTILQGELNRLSKLPDRITFHDELSPSYHPLYFADFVAAAKRHGLQFLSDASLRDMIAPPVKDEVVEQLKALARGDDVVYYQYLDLLLFRDFRRTLLCHQDVTLNRKGLRDQLAPLLIASPLTQSSKEPDGGVGFRNQRGPGSLQTNNPVIVAALQYLDDRWPQAAPFKELVAATLKHVAMEHHDEARSTLIEAILQLTCNHLMDLRSYAGSAIKQAGDRPLASSLARAQAKTGTVVTTLLHTQIQIQHERTRRLLESLDGTRDRRALVDYFLTQYQDIQRPGLSREIDKLVQEFGRLGLLIA